MKQGIRQSIIAGREAFSTAQRAQASHRISRRIMELPAYLPARTVMGILGFGAEFESDDWVRRVLADGKQLCLPRVSRATQQLDVYRVSDLDRQIEIGSYGIREPIPALCELADLAEIDFILLPGVAFGRDGSRLGYGGGFYDKLIARLPHQPVLVAAAFALQLVEGIPQEATDRKVDWLITENETIHCAAGSERT
ncbi:MAG: 5-formyltetrahydrofolate cyclo-ligase [Nitrosomonadales bacterium]|nr:5-formyltetrahydrofolate cyclo-ligase [Nitrosomonadales bacterium]